MNALTKFFKTAIVGGFIVVLPVVLIAILIGQLITSLVDIAEPLTEGLPFDPAVNAMIGIVIAVVAATLICFVTGLAARTALGEKIKAWLDATVLSKIPMYTIAKNLTGHMAGAGDTQFTPAEVDLYGADSRTLGLIVDELPDGRMAIFIPAAPMATVGQVHILPRTRVHILNTTLGATITSISQWGVGTKDLYEKITP
jgi:uncharacterized membrane protein